MHAPAVLARAAFRRLVDLALPPRCPGCGAVTREPHSFCLACWSALSFLGEPCCGRCGLPFEYDAGDGALCGGCLKAPPDFDRLRAAVAYGDISRKVAIRLKYSGRPGIAVTMAHFMARHVGEGDPPILAPVPLHRWRIWKRGYNQAALIASALARRCGGEVELALLERVKATPPLKGMNRRERALAVRGAFRVAGEAKARIAGRRVVLVDDVYTSGATANACARALRKSGAGRVEIVCWARVVRGGDH
ncbi:MAG: double zinc ribbon domain-containing protein [Allosphingosinicella sp.]|uniref:double zinc ribbon domain-containing protein n=1 Tax=Allosphingosinicella sp. TaxID=2823234 RepID=UPI00395D9A3A